MRSVFAVSKISNERKIILEVARLAGASELIECSGNADALLKLKNRSRPLVFFDGQAIDLDEECDFISSLASVCHAAYVVVFSQVRNIEAVVKYYKAGADEVIFRPVNGKDLWARVNNWLEVDQVSLIKEHGDVPCIKSEFIVNPEIVNLLNNVASIKDAEFGDHIGRVGMIAKMLATSLGIESTACRKLANAAPLHDLGKADTPDDILNKPAELSSEERIVMRSHTVSGFRMLSKFTFSNLDMAARIALLHHERFDGLGYPFGLAGHQIPWEVRCTTVADVFDALLHRRPYKKAWPVSDVFTYMKSQAGKHLCPKVVQALVSSRTEIMNSVENFNKHADDSPHSHSNVDFLDLAFAD